MSSSSTSSVSSNISPKKLSTDRHRKVEGRDRRILLSPACTRLLSELSIRLGHRTMGETIRWLLIQAKPSVEVVLGYESVYRPSQLPVFPSSNTTFGINFPTRAASTADFGLNFPTRATSTVDFGLNFPTRATSAADFGLNFPTRATSAADFGLNFPTRATSAADFGLNFPTRVTSAADFGLNFPTTATSAADFGLNFPTTACAAQDPTSTADPSLAIPKDRRFYESDLNVSAEMIQKFFSEFSV